MMKGYKSSIAGNFLVICYIGLIIYGCNGPEMVRDEVELTNYTLNPKKGLVQDKIKDKVKLQMLYRPTDLLVAQTLQDHNDTSEISSLRRQYGFYAYFILSISNEDKDALNTMSGSYQNFSENLQTLAFRMHDFVEMTTSKQDTIPLADFHFPRMYGLGGSTQTILVFDAEKLKESEWVKIRVKETGLSHGIQVFRFRVMDMINVPKIDFGK